MKHLRLALTLLLVLGTTAGLAACSGTIRDQGSSSASTPSPRAPGGRD